MRSSACGALAALLALGCHGRYVRPLDDAPIQRTPERVSRGDYLVNHVLACGTCHTSRANGNILVEPERADAFLGGGNVYTDQALGTLCIPNLTPDPDTGLGRWTDDEILRSLRDGVAPDGHFLIPLMPYPSFRHLSDEDARSVVAYLRSVPPVRQSRPYTGNKQTLAQKLLFRVVGVQMEKPAAGVTAPARADTLVYGRYLARIAACTECHSRAARGARPEGDPRYLAGSDLPFEDPALGATYARNLTPDPETGLGRYDAAALARALRTGRRLDGKPMAPPMSRLIPHLSGLTDEDLNALVAYLRSVPPAANRVPERALAPALRAELGD
jgi:mono/diheme cytochrome c family protein